MSNELKIDKEKLAENLKALRSKILNISRQQFEVLTGFSYATLRKIESEEYVKTATYEKLIEALQKMGVVASLKDNLSTYEITKEINNQDRKNSFLVRRKSFLQHLKVIYPNSLLTIYTIDKDESLYPTNTLLFGLKKKSGFSFYVGCLCIVSFVKRMGMPALPDSVSRLVSLSKDTLIFDDGKKLSLLKSEIDFLAPVFCVHYPDDFLSF